MRMRPFHLDTIANNFPELRLIGAHLGGTGNYDEAASVARWRHNVYFDFSGGTTIERHAVERRLIGHEIGFEKLIFGSDTSPEKIAEHIRRWDTIFDLLDVPEDCRERLWWLERRRDLRRGAARLAAGSAARRRPRRSSCARTRRERRSARAGEELARSHRRAKKRKRSGWLEARSPIDIDVKQPLSYICKWPRR